MRDELGIVRVLQRGERGVYKCVGRSLLKQSLTVSFGITFRWVNENSNFVARSF